MSVNILTSYINTCYSKSVTYAPSCPNTFFRLYLSFTHHKRSEKKKKDVPEKDLSGPPSSGVYLSPQSLTTPSTLTSRVRISFLSVHIVYFFGLFIFLSYLVIHVTVLIFLTTDLKNCLCHL